MHDPSTHDDRARDRSEEETFKREGPEPPKGDSGETVEEMNERAAESVIRNIRPDEQTD